MIQWLTGSPSPSLLPISVSGIGVSSGRCLGSGWGGRSEEPRLSGGLLGADMTTEPELLWTGVALLLLLGAAAGLCVRCSRPGAKKSEKIYEQRSLQENQQSFAVARTYSLIRQAWADPLVDAAPDTAQTRKDKLLQFSPSVEGSATPRYQNFSKGSRHGSDAAYVDPVAVDYYNWGQFRKPLEDEDDSSSYQNVLICRPGTPEPDDNSEDYQNSASIQQWRESRRAVELVLGEAPPSLAGSPDEDDSEPDYVNEVTVARDT
ncbi:linker for activation of T-cells family member 2 isoform X1 [Trichechus manatus latirostris]|uniref:Linker for activation of T-cells family member 2 isoform X1 n=1 Tax=Trichechus manatus latirostris TaxID=127582 RepID=A0A2Y9RHJ5_TRIMA|nr:linker for activation of T-cells family member 2 isoform X1 [Trichechus manatus latirostris]XP_023591053.1 linker for activation of T-cells family member 2 isoform X1 [Trichechus manatus latirostris]